MTPRVLTSLACLFALLSLTACGVVPTVLERPQVVELPPVEIYVELPASLTQQLAEPASPAKRCVKADGQAAVCVSDALGSIEDWRGVVGQCNADRATSAALSGAPRAALTPAPLAPVEALEPKPPARSSPKRWWKPWKD